MNTTEEPDPSFDGRSIRLAMLAKARVWLYVSHSFAQFSWRTLNFCIILFMGAFTGYKSLFLVSTYNLSINLTVCVFGSAAGQLIDRADRLFVFRFFVLWQNAACVLATVFSYMMLEHIAATPAAAAGIPAGPPYLDWLLSRLNGVPVDAESITLLVLIHISGSAGMILNQGFLVAVEKDWIVVMSKMASPLYSRSNMKTNKGTSTSNSSNPTNICDKESSDWLAETNVFLKQIDLASMIAAPAISGFILQLANNSASGSDHQSHHHAQMHLAGAAIFVGILNTVALVVEYVVSFRIFKSIPDLASKKVGPSTVGKGETMKSTESECSPILETDKDMQIMVVTEPVKEHPTESYAPLGRGCIAALLLRLPYGLRTYLSQSISLGGIGYCLL